MKFCPPLPSKARPGPFLWVPPAMLCLMERIHLEAADDHVQVLAHEGDPARAVVELIWNSLDADAHRVAVGLRRNDLDGVDAVTVIDDGHGMSPEAARTAFRWIGGSWKKTALRSQGEGRPLHGKSGQGRLRAFALGTTLRWATVADDTAGQRLRTNVAAASSSRNDFEVSGPTPTDEPLGTSFEATGRDNLDRLAADATRSRVSSALAPYLIAHPAIEVVYDGGRVDPADNIEHDLTLDLTWEHGDATHEARVRVIEWREAAERAVHLCDADGVPVDDLPDAPAPDFRYSAYVLWEGMPNHRNEAALADFEAEPSVVGALVDAVRLRLKDYFDERRAQKRREVVEGWKRQGTYPYPGEPQTEEEQVERATFDVVATSINRHVPAAKKQQKLTLGLLRESLQQRPSDVGELLDQFLGLPSEEREQLDRLLKRTSLSRVIQASTSVTNRLEFLRALELMVFDPEANKMVGEREHLHRILENELWVFGEQYNLMVSERGLTEVLRRHQALLGLEDTVHAPVKRLDGTAGRLDLVLSAAAAEHDRNRHLVVELKAPKVKAMSTELAQIKSYAKAVVADPRFASSSTVWDFWLVTSEMDSDVRQEITQAGRPFGLAFEPNLPEAPDAKVRVWVRDWGGIIEEARRRLDYFQKSLQHDPSLDDARDYLASHHGNVIPEGLLRTSSPNVGDLKPDRGGAEVA